MRELLVDFITSLDGYASGEGWPGWWGLQGPEYLGWLEERPDAPEVDLPAYMLVGRRLAEETAPNTEFERRRRG